MSKVLIIGAGGVGAVVTHKCAQHPEVFSEIVLASRTLAKCEAIQKQVARPIEIARVDADHPHEVSALIRKVSPDLVINVALPYQDLASWTPAWRPGSITWIRPITNRRTKPSSATNGSGIIRSGFKKRGIMALLGCGFDPGVTNIFCAYALKHHFDEIHTIDIMDCNAGDHGHPFATNFNPEINIREVTASGKYYENGQWIETDPLVRPQAL